MKDAYLNAQNANIQAKFTDRHTLHTDTMILAHFILE